MNKKVSKFHVTESDLLCKNRCGFYGNTAWKGYCSVCYKSVTNRKSQQPAHNDHRETGGARMAPRAVVASEQSFAKFEERRPRQSDRITGTMRSFFSKSSKKERSEVHSGSKVRASGRHVEPSTQHRSRKQTEFSMFLQQLGENVYEDISKKAQTFLIRFKQLASTSGSVDALSASVQDFYAQINDHISTSPIFQGMEETQVNELLDHLEMHVMNRLYNTVFCSTTSDDETQDCQLQRRIKSLHWVTMQHLEANIDDKDLGVRSALDKSISDITELDTRRSPKEKLKCIVDCSRHIFEALKMSAVKSTDGGNVSAVSATSADDFLPVFIFIILKASPPRLKSNINYITRFACPSRLNSGEGGYFFTNMCCVVDFIEKLNAESLSLSKNDFDNYMSGDAIPEGTNSVYMCDGLRLMHENSLLIEKLKERQVKCESNVQKLEQRLAEFRDEFDEQINASIQRAPLTLKPRRRRADIDTDLDIPTSLPTPLQPQPL